VIIGIIAARPGSILIRVSPPRCRSGPEHEAREPRLRITAHGRRACRHRAPRAARSRSSPTPLIEGSAPQFQRAARQIAARSSTVEIFGTRMPSGFALPAIADIVLPPWAYPGCWCGPRFRGGPNPFAAIAAAICSARLPALASGATESSKSRIRQSAGEIFRAFSQRPRAFRSRHEQQAAARADHERGSLKRMMTPRDSTFVCLFERACSNLWLEVMPSA